MTFRTLKSLALLGIAALAMGEASARAGQVDLTLGGTYSSTSYLNYTFNGATGGGGGGSINPSYINSGSGNVALPYVYCVDLADDVGAPGEYKNTLATDTGQVWLGHLDGSNVQASGNTGKGFLTVNNAGSVAWLLHNETSVNMTQAEQAGLQAAIWKVIYGSQFVLTNGPSANQQSTYSYYTTFYNAVTGGSSNASTWKTFDVNSLLWLSPSNDPSISSTHAPGTVAQALVTINPDYHGSGVVPEPATIVSSSMGIVLLAGFRMWRRRRAVLA